MIEVGKVIEVKFSEGNVEYYIRTGKKQERFGKEYEVFCKCKNPKELTAFDLWLVSEEYYKKMESEGMLREINSFKDLLG